MKITIFCILFFLTATFCNAQVKLDSKDLTNLIAMAELYSQNTNAAGDEFSKSIDSFRTPTLNRIADTLIAVGKGDGTILDTRFLRRPSDEELALWYVIREIHYNRTSDKQKPRSSAEVAKDVLSKRIDSRWLLDNYYYRIRGGIASYFNSADLSKYDFKIEDFGLKDNTEKAIFFLNTIDALVGGRFKVLLMTRNNKQILSFCDRLPKFNGKEYYFYKNFEYADFDWIGYEERESYNKRHIGNLYIALIAHSKATAELRDKKAVQEVFLNSILNEPKYFKFSEVRDYLQTQYDAPK